MERYHNNLKFYILKYFYDKIFLNIMQELQLIIFLLFILITTAIFSPGDRISTLTQVSHRGWKTPYADVAIENMPRFQYSAKSVIRVTLPSENRDSKEEANIDPNYDVKVSLTFSENKLIIPQIYLFDSKERKSLQKLIVTFHHDKYELQRLNYETICKFMILHFSTTFF